MQLDEAVILAGGLGTRLRSEVADLPKVMAPINGRPFLEYQLAHLAKKGFRRVILAVSYLRETVMEHFKSEFAGLRIDYSVEISPLGTGGGLRQALSQVEGAAAFAFNGDTYFDVDYAGMERQWLDASGAGVSMALRSLSDAKRYGMCRINNGRVVGFAAGGGNEPGFVNGGCYILPRDVFGGFSLPQTFSFEADFLEAHADSLRPMAFLESSDNFFIDIGVPETYRLAQGLFGRVGEFPKE
ncbi:nucleotidyltransferase family protein [Fundidesulfovibrio soli]|uniref:nucleotidyltransferase family protein n=1 Tax=Fundidesulfovibrio soli TaxID=2922716 RepID=UPI001FAF27D4|nr:nucleotidyltransferase family protein [Fundidesulfovibrio soli]